MIGFYRIKFAISIAAATFAVMFIAYLKFGAEHGWYSIIRLLQTNFIVIIAFVIYAAFFYDLLSLASDKKDQDTQLRLSTGRGIGAYQVPHVGKFALYFSTLVLLSVFLMGNPSHSRF